MRRLKRFVVIPLFSSALFFLFAGPATAERPAHFDNPTKLLNVETAYTLNEGGNIKVGIGESGVGFGNRFQITTNTLLDVLSFLNVQAKVGLLLEDGKIPAVAVGGGYYSLVTAGFWMGKILDNALSTDGDMGVDAGLNSWYLFASVSKQLHKRIRGHISYQHRCISGHFDSDDPITLTSDGDDFTVFASLDQNVHQRCIMAALDADASDRLKLMLELGYDGAYEKVRGGFGLRIAATEHFAIQAGILFPGIDLGDDFNMPVLPSLSFFWRL